MKIKYLHYEICAAYSFLLQSTSLLLTSIQSCYDKNRFDVPTKDTEIGHIQMYLAFAYTVKPRLCNTFAAKIL